jgi:GTP-binding protein EngB required for normal cell division
MQEASGRLASSISLADARLQARVLIEWFKTQARPFLATNAPEVLPPLDNDADRLARVLDRPERVTVCFLGHSGVGKSTLLNALAGGKDYVLPAGGMGPLTALATEVSYREKPWLRASYHKRSLLWRVGFALEQAAQRSGQSRGDQSSVFELSADERSEIETELAAQSSETGEKNSPITSYKKQAQQIVTGDQFGERQLAYLVNALRFACGYEAKEDILPDDRVRLERVQQALAFAEKDLSFELESDGNSSFGFELKVHTTGFLAPIIRKIHVGWPSSLLRAGVDLVDLPGVGVAGDAYRSATQAYIRSSARAVILTVDRAGLTSETIELLRYSGYWDRLMGAVDDPSSDPCNLFVAITKVDDVSNEEWRNLPQEGRPKRRDFFANTRAAFRRRMRSQIGITEVKIRTASEALPVKARTLARLSIPLAFQIAEPFSSASAISSSDCACAMV